MHIQAGDLHICTLGKHAVHQGKPAIEHLGGIKPIAGGNSYSILEPSEHLFLVERPVFKQNLQAGICKINSLRHLRK